MTDYLVAYRQARSRFVISDDVQDGEPVKTIEDPEFAIRLAVPIAQAALLPSLFRSFWTAQAARRHEAKGLIAAMITGPPH